MLDVVDLTVRRGARVVVRRADLLVKRGERVAVHGPSGCGKTTLLHAIAGLLAVDTGQILLDGVDIT
ncbi:MAG: hypothetical protein RLZZ88_968, partial [Actinomycetota bacterium]